MFGILSAGAPSHYNVGDPAATETSTAMARFCLKHLLALSATLLVVSFLIFAV